MTESPLLTAGRSWIRETPLIHVGYFTEDGLNKLNKLTKREQKTSKLQLQEEATNVESRASLMSSCL